MTTNPTLSRSLAGAVARCETGNPFPAKYAGTCAMTGMTFCAGDRIRAAEVAGRTYYVADRAISATDLRCAVDDLENELERTRPFVAADALAWLDEGRVVVLLKRTGAAKKIDGKRWDRPSEKQFAARTRSVVWMIRREVIR